MHLPAMRPTTYPSSPLVECNMQGAWIAPIWSTRQATRLLGVACGTVSRHDQAAHARDEMVKYGWMNMFTILLDPMLWQVVSDF